MVTSRQNFRFGLRRQNHQRCEHNVPVWPPKDVLVFLIYFYWVLPLLQAQEQIKGVLPVLDVLDGISNLLNLINPLIYVRWGKKLGAYFIGKHSRTMALEKIDEGSGRFATRAEEIEVDDVNRNVKEKDFWQRGEPPPWGTVRLTDFGERFSILTIKANVLGFCFFVLSVAGYLVMIFGEVCWLFGEVYPYLFKL